MEITVLFDEGLEGNLPSSEWLKTVVEHALAAEGASHSSEVSVLIAEQEKVHELNRAYLDEDRPTDVLSFPMLAPDAEKVRFVAPPDGLVHLGEIIISLPQAVQQAQERGHSASREIAILTIHGVLHLLGYDHAEPGPGREMRRREKEILDGIETEQKK